MAQVLMKLRQEGMLEGNTCQDEEGKSIRLQTVLFMSPLAPIVSFEAASVKVIFMVSPLPPHEIQIPECGVHGLTISLQLTFARFECSNFLLHCPFTNFTFHFHGTYAYVLSKSQIIVKGLCWKKKKSFLCSPRRTHFQIPRGNDV